MGILGEGGGRAVAVTVFVSGLLSARVSAVQHYRLCWPDFQCEPDPIMYLYLVVFNCLCVVSCNCVFFFLFPCSFVCLLIVFISNLVKCFI